MVEIKAFVGHSFTDDDQVVVDRFLKYFDQLSNSLPEFGWVHAKAAEPAELAKKVLRLIADCNTFIAICTKKEVITRDDALRVRFLVTDSVIVSKDDLSWKTSDWIIQEIGLAIGREMSIIILLEDGCRRPGGLQGDVEFIPFHRSYPERAFGQLLEMLQALSPAATVSTPAVREDDRKQEDENLAAFGGNEMPDETWTPQHYEDAYFWRLVRNKADEAEKIGDAYLRSAHASSAELISEWNAKTERFRIVFGKSGQISRLREIYLSNRTNPKIIADYAVALGSFDQHRDAAALYLEATDCSDDAKEKRVYQVAAVLQHANGMQMEEAFRLLNSLRMHNDASSEGQASLAQCIRSVGLILKDDQLEIEAMERLIQINPDDYDTRFSLAYAHSKFGNEDMALEHYLSIPLPHRSSAAWNNLGVAYQNFSTPALAVDAYCQSADGNETLAMSNLAYRYLNAGFLREARVQLDRAMAQESPHRNVGEAYAAFSDLPDKETKQIEEVRSTTKSKSDFYRRLCEAVTKPNPAFLPSRWRSPDCELEVEITGRNFRARGRYTVSGNALSGLLGVKTSSEYRIDFEGHMVGHRVAGEMERKAIKEQPDTWLGSSFDGKKKFAIVFNDDLSSAVVAENLISRTPRYYDILKIIGDPLVSS